MQLLWREGAALWDDGLAIAPVEVGAFDRAVVEVRNAHVGPIDVTCFDIDDDAVGEWAPGDDHLAVASVGIHRQDTAVAQVENEQATDSSFARWRRSRSVSLECGHVFLPWLLVVVACLYFPFLKAMSSLRTVRGFTGTCPGFSISSF